MIGMMIPFLFLLSCSFCLDFILCERERCVFLGRKKRREEDDHGLQGKVSRARGAMARETWGRGVRLARTPQHLDKFQVRHEGCE